MIYITALCSQPNPVLHSSHAHCVECVLPCRLLCSGKGEETQLNGGQATYEVAGMKLGLYRLIIKQ